ERAVLQHHHDHVVDLGHATIVPNARPARLCSRAGQTSVPDRADCTVSLAQVEPEVAAAGRGWETGATTAPEELGHTTQGVCGVRARGKGGRAGRRAGARVLVLSLVATVPGTGQPVALAGGPQPQVDPTGDVSGAPLQAAPPGGLTGPGWSPEPPSEQAEELATLSGLHAPSARLPF